MNSHQRRKRRRFWERAIRRADAVLRQVYAPAMPTLIPRRPLLLGVDFTEES